MKNKILIILLIILIFPMVQLGAYEDDWGVRLDLNLDFPEVWGSVFGITTDDTLKFDYRGRWSDAAKIEFNGGLGFDGTFMLGVDTDFSFSYNGLHYKLYPILDKMNFYGNTGMFGYSGGRQLISDPAGLILRVPFDAVSGSIDIGKHIFRAGAGYTGLQFGQSTEYFLTRTDASRSYSSAFTLAVPRLMEFASWEMPALTSWMNISAFFLALQDLTSPEDQADSESSRFNAMYLELKVNGLLGSNFMYSAAGIGQFGKYGSLPVAAAAGRLGLSWLPGTRTQLGVDVISTTGDTWNNREEYLLGKTGSSAEKLNQYIPVSTVSTQGYVVEFEIGNLTSVSAFFNNRPGKNFSWEIRATTFIRNSTGPVASLYVNDKTVDNAFLGEEGLLTFNWRPKSDFGWSWKMGVMYPGEAINLNLMEEIEKFFPVLYRMGFDFSWSF